MRTKSLLVGTKSEATVIKTVRKARLNVCYCERVASVWNVIFFIQSTSDLSFNLIVIQMDSHCTGLCLSWHLNDHQAFMSLPLLQHANHV